MMQSSQPLLHVAFLGMASEVSVKPHEWNKA